MAKRINIDGKFYRNRRGKLVQIPDEWLGKTTDRQTIKKRNSISRRTRKNKKIKFLVRKIERKNEHDFDIEMFPYKYDKPDYQNPEFLTLYCDIAIIRYK